MDADEPVTRERIATITDLARLSDSALEEELTIAASHQQLDDRLQWLLAERQRRREAQE